MPADKIGIYILQKQIGKGGMGAVHLAHDPTLDRPVAIKILPAELAADPDYVARFEREATSLAKIRHPNLVHIYAVGCDQGRHYIAMEYIRGRTLDRILRKQGRLHYKVAIRVLGQVLSALDKVHAAGIVHRDLKASNIMIDEDKRAILMDFGLAKPRHDRSVTTGHTIIGTPEYMAPELAEGHDAGFRSDIYALGIVLYEMLAGSVPFRGTSAIATLRQHVETPLPPLADAAPGVPPELGRIVASALAKKPDGRYATVRELATDLVAVRRTSELARLATARPASSTAPTLPIDGARTAATMPAAGGRPRWLVPAIVAAACLVAVLVGALALPPLFRGSQPPRAVEPHAPPDTGGSPATAAPAATMPPKAPPTSTAAKVAVSKRRYRITTRGDLELTGRIVSMDSEKVRVQTDDGLIETFAYRSVLRIEPSGGE